MSRSASGIQKAARPFRLLEQMAESALDLKGVRRRDIRAGDRLVVSTLNSRYCLTACDDGLFLAAGGWFDRSHKAPVRIAINGCTAGGKAIYRNLVAAPGLFLEFGNRVVTTRIQRTRLIRGPNWISQA